MPIGVYERTPEMNANNSKAHTGVPLSSEHCDAMSKGLMEHSVSEETKSKISNTLTGYKHTEEAKKNMLDGRAGYHISDTTKKKISDSVIIAYKEHPETHVEGIEAMRGGNDIVRHHYIYDHSDLSKYTMEVTRNKHNQIHGLMMRSGIKVPHINIKGVL